MISILIPTYNCSIVHLVKRLHEQLINSEISFEIICLDDASQSSYTEDNKIVNSWSNTRYLVSTTNMGRAVTKQILCDKAQYAWILFLDADVELKDESFVSNYLKAIETGYDFIFGGFDYKEIKPKSDYCLRWKYGRKHEAISAKLRNKSPYKVTIAANLLAKKARYKNIQIHTIGNTYGMDLFLGIMLKKTKAKVLHIDNPVYHTGIEKNSDYIIKKERAAISLLKLYNDGIRQSSNALLNTYIGLKKIKLNYLFAGIFKIFRSKMIKNLSGPNPNINILHFYRISFMSWKDLNS
jgi:glycosyltransferase involved in cell wall biosynthesis